MTTVSHLSQIFQHLLQDYPRQIEREVGFVQRNTAQLDGSRFVRTLVLGWMHEPQASYSQLTAVTNSLGTAVSPQALEQRFTPAAVRLLKAVFQEASLQAMTAECEQEVPELLGRFAGVYLQDGSVISLPEALAGTYPSTRTSRKPTGNSSLRIQVRWEFSQGGIDGIWLQAGRDAEGKGVAQKLDLARGSLFVGDIGYLSAAEMKQRGTTSYWLTPTRANTVLFDERGVRFDLVSFLQARGQSGWVDAQVQVGVKERLSCRLVAFQQEGQTGKKRRHGAPKSRKGVQRCLPGQTKYQKGQKERTRQKLIKSSPARQRLGKWIVLLTNLPQEKATREEVRVLMRVRWQEELLWKLWKQYAKLDTWRSEKAERIETEIYAKLIAVLIEHWLTIVGCWHNPKRSLRKAQQVCQWMSNGLSLALQGKMDLEELIGEILKPMQKGCRVDARRKKPSTYQYIARRSLSSS
jgi:hypothetical protein